MALTEDMLYGLYRPSISIEEAEYEYYLAGLKKNTLLAFWQGAFDGLSHMHRHGLIHGDVQPRNIHVTLPINKEKCQIIDYELVSTIGKPISCPGVGTQGFAPNEIMFGDTIAQPTIDVYGLGQTIWVTLHGVAEYVPDFAHKKKDYEARYPRSFCQNPVSIVYGDSISRVLGKAIERDPERRYQTMDEFWVQFSQAFETIGDA